MKDDVAGFEIEAIDSLQRLDEIEKGYRELFERGRSPSFYCSYDFVRTAWLHFRARSDRLLVLVVRRDARLIAVAPFMIEPEPMLFGIPFRVIKYVAEWGDGDKPGIVTTEDEGLVWRSIQGFLTRTFGAWDAIVLDEQPLGSPALDQDGLFDGPRYSVRHTPPLWSYRADIAGDWTDYVRALKGKVRGDWARCRRRLSEHAPPLSFDFFEDPGDIGGALERYVALERQTWKGGAEFSIGGNPGQFGFYKDLVQRLAPEGMVAIGFLTSGTKDAAAAMVFRGGGVVYGAHICYDPSLAKFSPGVILNAEVMKRHFDSQYRFFDFLALQGGDSDSRFKAAWANESQELTGITIYKRGLRFMLYRASHWWRDVRKPLGDRRRGG